MKATYEDIQRLKTSIVHQISAFRHQFEGAMVKVAFETEITTNHGAEKIKVTINDIPPYAQGRLPGMHEELLEGANEDEDEDEERDATPIAVTGMRWKR